MQYKALAVDIDGTLECTVKRILSSNSLNELTRLQKNKVPVLVATGRAPFIATPAFLRGFNANYTICVNGACVLNKAHKPIYENRLLAADVEHLINYCKNFDCLLYFIFEEAYYAYQGFEKFVATYSNSSTIHRSSFIKEGSKQKRHKKSLPYGAYITMEDPSLTSSFASSSIDGIKFMQCSSHSFDVSKQSIDKKTGIELVLEKQGISWNEVVAIGDSENDLGMIKAAGMGVAMGNAKDKVKAAANYVTGSTLDDGVATAIEKFFKF